MIEMGVEGELERSGRSTRAAFVWTFSTMAYERRFGRKSVCISRPSTSTPSIIQFILYQTYFGYPKDQLCGDAAFVRQMLSLLFMSGTLDRNCHHWATSWCEQTSVMNQEIAAEIHQYYVPMSSLLPEYNSFLDRCWSTTISEPCSDDTRSCIVVT